MAEVVERVVEFPGVSLVPADQVPRRMGPVQVIARARPFSEERIEFGAPQGTTLEAMIRTAGIPPGIGARVFIEREGKVYGPIPRAQWAIVKPKAGARVVIRAVASGGGSGGDSNKTLRMVLLVVIIIIAIVIVVLTWGTTAAAAGLLIAGLVMTVGFLAVNMLLPPQSPKLGKLAALNNAMGKAPESATMSITGSQNKANPYGPVPKIYGRHRIFVPARAEVPA